MNEITYNEVTEENYQLTEDDKKFCEKENMSKADFINLVNDNRRICAEHDAKEDARKAREAKEEEIEFEASFNRPYLERRKAKLEKAKIDIDSRLAEVNTALASSHALETIKVTQQELNEADRLLNKALKAQNNAAFLTKKMLDEIAENKDSIFDAKTLKLMQEKANLNY